jgi:type II secretory pathway pseudopilin PulG
VGLFAQTAYQPKFPGDPAHSDAEAAALGYMRTVASAQREYKKRHGAYAKTLRELVGSVSFTRRMIKTDRGDYTVKFQSTGKDYWLAMVPRQFDAAHRAFYMDDSGVIRAEADKLATKESPPVKS